MSQRILIVEDQDDNRRILRDLLSNAGFELLEATTGEEGVRLAEINRPDLILMDVQLPKMSGLDATRVLKADPRTGHIPIIVITSFALSGDREKASAAGANSYLAKPYSPRELLALVRQFLPEP